MADEAHHNCPHNVCKPHQFQCLDKSCISSVFYCDHDYDCADKSDEPENCEQHCYGGEFRCKNGKCILEQLKCDKNDNCGDGSDEAAAICETAEGDYCKGRGLFRCGNGVCINDTLLCDGENNCGDFSDEHKCSKCSSPLSSDSLFFFGTSRIHFIFMFWLLANHNYFLLNCHFLFHVNLHQFRS